MDVLAVLGEQERNGQVLVGFGAEAGEAGLDRKRRMLTDKNLDLVVYNDVSAPGIGFDAPENEVDPAHAGRRAGAGARPEGARSRPGSSTRSSACWRSAVEARRDPAAVASLGGDASSASSRTSRASCTRRPTRFGSASSACSPRGT